MLVSHCSENMGWMEDLQLERISSHTGNPPFLKNMEPYGSQFFIPETYWLVSILLSFLSILNPLRFVLLSLIIMLLRAESILIRTSWHIESMRPMSKQCTIEKPRKQFDMEYKRTVVAQRRERRICMYKHVVLKIPKEPIDGMSH